MNLFFQKIKIRLIFLILLLPFFHTSFVSAQDTIVLRNGKKMDVKVISFAAGEITYSIPNDSNPRHIANSKINYIKYADGSRYTIGESDVPFRSKPYVLISAGLALPWAFSGYGADSYNSDPDEGYGYSGYAEKGYEFSATAGWQLSRSGWELTGMFSYIRNELDATGIVSETINNFHLGQNIIYVQNISAIGNYAYSNFPIFAGFTKNWGKATVHAGISFLFGDFITYTPALHGIVTGQGAYGYNQNPVGYYFNMNSETQNNFIFNMGMHLDNDITKHIFIRFLLEFQLSGLQNSGGYQFADMNGNTVSSGTYNGNSYASSSFFVGLTNLSIGLGYKF